VWVRFKKGFFEAFNVVFVAGGAGKTSATERFVVPKGFLMLSNYDWLVDAAVIPAGRITCSGSTEPAEATRDRVASRVNVRLNKPLFNKIILTRSILY